MEVLDDAASLATTTNAKKTKGIYLPITNLNVDLININLGIYAD